MSLRFRRLQKALQPGSVPIPPPGRWVRGSMIINPWGRDAMATLKWFMFGNKGYGR